MRTTTWKDIPGTMDLVRDLATVGKGNAAIAKAVSERFGIFVNPNQVAGCISRMKDVPWRLRGPRPVVDLFAWVTSKPEWGTPDADALVIEANKRRISAGRIGNYFGVGHATIIRLLNKMAGRPRDTPKVRTIASVINAEWPEQDVRALEAGWLAGEPTADIAVRLHKSDTAVSKKASRMVEWGLLPRRPVVQKRRKPQATSASPPKINRVALERTMPVSTARGLVLTGLTKPQKCAWSGCTEVPFGKWCHEHQNLLCAPAAEIIERLGEWR